MSGDPRGPEHTAENSGIRGICLKNSDVEKFAQNMTKNIMQPLLSQVETVEPETGLGVSGFNQTLEIFAEGLASAVTEVSLNEVCQGQSVEDPHSSRSVGVYLPFRDWSVSKTDHPVMDTEMDPSKGTQTSKDTRPCHPPLSLSGLPLMGLPPTTPLLPELLRSRCSFDRKLKGGLAKVFLPSPPPPTPQDKDHGSDSAAMDPGVESTEHLMHSLPTDDSAGDHREEAPRHGAKLKAFAEALSCDLINWVLSSEEQIADESDAHLRAHQLADTIITSSLDEARMLL